MNERDLRSRLHIVENRLVAAYKDIEAKDKLIAELQGKDKPKVKAKTVLKGSPKKDDSTKGWK